MTCFRLICWPFRVAVAVMYRIHARKCRFSKVCGALQWWIVFTICCFPLDCEGFVEGHEFSQDLCSQEAKYNLGCCVSITSLMDNLVFVQESGNCTTMDPFKIFKRCQTWMTQALGFKSNQRGWEHCHCDTQPLLTELILSEGHWCTATCPNSWANNTGMLCFSKSTSLWMPATKGERSSCISELNWVKYVSSDVILLLFL